MKEERVNHIKSFLQEYELSHILISDPISVRYCSGFQSSNVLLLISARKNYLFTDFRYKEVAEKFCKKNTFWKFIEMSGSDYSFLKKYIKEGSRVGIQSNILTIDQFDELKKGLKKVRLKKISHSLTDTFCVKMRPEIRSMEKAALISEHAFQSLLQKIKPGMNEIAVAKLLDSLCLELGSEKPSFDSIVLFGPRTALPHGVPSKAKLKKGHLILCDFGCTVNGYYSDITRTVCLGKASKRQKRIYEIVFQAHDMAKKAVCTGKEIGSVDKAARSIIEKAGFGKNFGHSTGHGIGLKVHENPRVYYNNRDLLVKNMIFTIEPGIYVPGFGGVRIEDMIRVTGDGAHSFTQVPKELLEI